MEREIAFRVWDKENKKMHYFDKYWLDPEDQCIAFGLNPENDKQENSYSLNFEEEDRWGFPPS